MNGQRHVAEASRAYRGQWDVLDRHTGAKVCGSGNRERAERYAQQLNTAYLAQQHLRIASLELPGIQSGAHEPTRLRSVAMTLVRWGFIPYGLAGVDHADVPGFLVLSCPDQPRQVVVRRVVEPWGDARPTAAQGVWGAGRRFDRDLAAYARCLSGPGLRAVVAGEQVRMTFTAAPARTGRLGGVVPIGRQRQLERG
ncbi:hypothetical protein ACFWXK_10230 [Streptomyces sp. NPDC059070]|uniref:hypothetical protein n=1 Tax=Streptomyces sp. NPDC059070 TaxID=3346713 RepID=UPI00369CF1D4